MSSGIRALTGKVRNVRSVELDEASLVLHSSAWKDKPAAVAPINWTVSLFSSSTAVLLGDPQPLPHVQPVWIHLDASERALPEPLPVWAISPNVPCVPHHPSSFSFQPGALWTYPVLQLQPLRPPHEPGHMELFFQPQLQFTAIQRLRLLWRCLK